MSAIVAEPVLDTIWPMGLAWRLPQQGGEYSSFYRGNAMKRLFFACCAAAVLAGPALAAQRTTIDFQDQLGSGQQFGPLVYPEVFFTSISGRVYIYENALGNKTLSSWNAAGDATDPLDFVFSKPVDNLSFFVGEDDIDFSTLFVRIFQTGNPNFLDVQFANFGDGNPTTFHAIDLGSYGQIDQITLSSSDPLGVSVDLVAFNAVPEPDVWALLIAGFGLVGWSMRRRGSVAGQLATS